MDYRLSPHNSGILAIKKDVLSIISSYVKSRIVEGYKYDEKDDIDRYESIYVLYRYYKIHLKELLFNDEIVGGISVKFDGKIITITFLNITLAHTITKRIKIPS